MTDKTKAPGQLLEKATTMADERTPLIATVRVGEPRQRYSHHVVRRFCTIALSSCLLAGFITFLTLIFIDPPPYPHHRHGHHHGDQWDSAVKQANKGHPGHQDVLDILFDTPSAERAEEWSRYYTSGPHLAGQNFSQVSSCKEEDHFIHHSTHLLLP